MTRVEPVPSVALVVLDGWGLARPGPATQSARPRHRLFDALWERYPHTELDASGRAVAYPTARWATRRWVT